MNYQCALGEQKDTCDLGCIKNTLNSLETYLVCCVQLCGPQHRKDVNLVKQVQRRAMKMTSRLENCYEDWQREFGLFSLEKRRC